MVKAMCDSMKSCGGFVYRVRDGAGVLGGSFAILEEGKSEGELATKKRKFKSKTPRSAVLYVKDPKRVSWSGTIETKVDGLSGGNSVCLPLGHTPLRGPPPFAETTRCSSSIALSRDLVVTLLSGVREIWRLICCSKDW